MDRKLQDIQTLLRMAAEAEAIEHPAGLSSPRLHAGNDRSMGSSAVRHRSRAVRFGTWAALAAACLAGALWIGVLKSPPPPQPIAVNPGPPSPRIVVHPVRSGTTPGGEPTVTLAIYRDESGDVRCVQWRPHAWMASVSAYPFDASSPLGLPTDEGCTGAAARVLMVSLAGPLDRLPTSDASATALAQCITQSHANIWAHASTGDECLHASDAACCCLPTGVSVRVESVAMR